MEDKLKDLITTHRQINRAIDIHNNVVNLSKDCDNPFVVIETNVKKELIPFLGGNLTNNISNFAGNMKVFLEGKVALSDKLVSEMEQLLVVWKVKNLADSRAKVITEDDLLANLNTQLSDLQEKLKKAKDSDKPALLVRIKKRKLGIRQEKLNSLTKLIKPWFQIESRYWKKPEVYWPKLLNTKAKEYFLK